MWAAPSARYESESDSAHNTQGLLAAPTRVYALAALVCLMALATSITSAYGSAGATWEEGRKGGGGGITGPANNRRCRRLKEERVGGIGGESDVRCEYRMDLSVVQLKVSVGRDEVTLYYSRTSL